MFDTASDSGIHEEFVHSTMVNKFLAVRPYASSLQRSHASAQLPDVGGESAQLLLRGCAKSINDSYIV
jgi:hypothetical protein